MKVLILGFGKHAIEYAKVLNYLRIKIDGIAVRNKKNYFNLKKKFKIRNVYTNIGHALENADYDFVLVVLPWFEIEKKIFLILKKSKKNIFCEKPICLSFKKLKKLTIEEKKYKIKIFAIFNRRFYKNIIKVRKILFKDFDSLYLEINEKVKKAIKIHSKKIIGNIRFHLTSHWLDTLIWISGNSKFKVNNFEDYSILTNKKKNIFVQINYKNNNAGIRLEACQDKKKIKFDTYEKLVIFENKKVKKFYEDNGFKPGLLNVVKQIKNFNKINNNSFSRPGGLVPLYYILNKLKV